MGMERRMTDGNTWGYLMTGTALNSESPIAPWVVAGSQKPVNEDRSELYT